MKTYILVILLLLFLVPATGKAQLTLDRCQKKARANYPLIKRAGLISQTATCSLENAAKGYLPQFSFSAKATYQSDVTEIPISLPNLHIDGLTRDQYQAVAEVNQTLWDGGLISSQQKITAANAEFEKQKLETDLYALRERVNQLFFGILLIDEQLKQNELLQKELQTNLDRVSSFVKYGIANQADIDAIKVEQLNAAQRRVELMSAQQAYRDMLSAMTGESLTASTALEKPLAVLPPDLSLAKRPEMKLFEAQKGLLDEQANLVDARNMPKIGAFMQGGYGKPGLNMLKNEFSPFAIGGVRMSWNFGGLYTRKNELKLLDISKSGVAVQKETFEFNTSLQLTQLNHEVEKYRQLITNDDEIIALRNSIKKVNGAKVENGTASVTDLIRDINAEAMARQSKALHEMQLLISIYNLKNTANN